MASKEEPNASELESKSANRNYQILANEMIHEPEPDVFSSEEMQRYTICKMTCGRRISVMKGSLVDLRVDVMVNTTDKALSLTTGLAETISEKGGEKIRTACYKYFQKQGSIDEGEAFVSEAGSLPAKHVVHVNSPIKREETEDELRLLRQTVMNAMMQASVKNAQTIALPAISCGISGQVCLLYIHYALKHLVRYKNGSI
ncbi:macro domain-containing protein LIC_13295-like [Mercenaria mercenaria]|uniref:macro domain-containing protein LIC_13295-like n=1 Tax=Mercenaria mercenaria TaxID=6596 RepID=UPI00234E735C|nr:macro domain-containing protein LIC_13295-like [Mercenaria mercenaria]